MKTNDFFDAMGNIDCSLIERADGKQTATHRPILKIAAVAASFALLIVGAILALPMLIGEDTPPLTQDAIVWENVFESVVHVNGGGLKIQEVETALVESAFAEIQGGKYEKYKLGNCFPLESGDEFIGRRLDEIKVRTGWYLHFEDRETDVVTVKAEVYEIKGVSIDAAVAVKYLEIGASNTTEHYYAAVNTEYGFTTLADFLDDFNAEVHMNIGKDVYLAEYEQNLSGKAEKYRLKDGAGSDIVKILLGFDAEAEIEGYYDEPDEKTAGCDEILRFTFAMNSAGKTTNFLYVFDNGYIAIQGFCDGYAFFNVGREATDAILEAFEESGELIVPTVSPEDGDGLVEATTSAPVNEAVPE